MALETLGKEKTSKASKLTHLPAASEDNDDNNNVNVNVNVNGPLSSFCYVLPNPDTQQDYLIRLGYFFDFLKIPGDTVEDRATTFLERAQSDHKYANNCLTNFVSYLKNDTKRKLAGGTIKNYYAVVKLFYEASSINLNWKWISKGLPASSHVANDRAPTLEEIRKLIEYPDRRIKVILYVMVSSGIRVDAWNYLKYKHITPIKNDKTGQVIAAKLKVYDGLPDPYFSFVTPEAYQQIQEYMDFRASHGEKITGESWLIRDKFLTTSRDKRHRAIRSLATNPKKLSVAGIKKILERALCAQNIRTSPLDLGKGQRRYEFKIAHGYRKYFKSNAERAMRPLNVEMLMDHKTGVSDSYYRPQEQELLDDYIKAVDFLTINRDEKAAIQLQKQVAELTEKSEQRLAEKEKESENVKKQLEELQKQQEDMIHYFHTQMEVMVRNTIERELGTVEKEKPGIRKLTERGNYAVHWGDSRRDDGEEAGENPSSDS